MLQTVAFLLPDMSYCQGMNYIVSALFAYLNDEELTFNLFLALLL